MRRDFQDRIDEYILDRMSDEDKAQFEEEVSKDKTKKEQREYTRDVKNAITSREDKLARIRMMQRMYDSKHRQTVAAIQATGTDGCQYDTAPQYAAKRPSKRIWWWVSGIAVAFIIGIFVVNPFSSDSLHTPFGVGSNEIIRGGKGDIFDTKMPTLNSLIEKDTTLSHDTAIVNKEIIEGRFYKFNLPLASSQNLFKATANVILFPQI